MLSEVAPTLGIDPACCDLGLLGAPIPYAFGPSLSFSSTAGQAPCPHGEQDTQAELLISNALAAGGTYYNANGFTWRG